MNRIRLLGGLLTVSTAYSSLVSGCSSSGSDASHHASNPPSQEATARDDTSRDDLTNEQAVPWERHEIVSENTIRLFFTARPKSCFGVRAVVKETETTVEVAVLEGKLPDAPKFCTLEARKASIVVETEQPIADREVVVLTNP